MAIRRLEMMAAWVARASAFYGMGLFCVRVGKGMVATTTGEAVARVLPLVFRAVAKVLEEKVEGAGDKN